MPVGGTDDFLSRFHSLISEFTKRLSRKLHIAKKQFRPRRRVSLPWYSESLEVRQLLSATTTTTVVASVASPVVGQSETLTATIASPSGTPNAGTVSFFSGPTLLGTQNVINGVATFTTSALPMGLNVVSATYSGDGANYSSSSTQLSASSVVNIVAGTGGYTFGGDGGIAVDARLSSPSYVAVDKANNLFISDKYNDRVRRVDAITHVITTVAGSGNQFYNGDGIPATSANLTSPSGLAVDDSGNLYIADELDDRIRKVDAVTQLISTVAGTGVAGFNGDNISATSAQLNYPEGIAVDSAGNLFIADMQNNRIRKVNAQTHQIVTIAGTGVAGFSGDGQAATAAQLKTPEGVALDAAGNLYIADTNNFRVREVNATTGLISTVAGSGNFQGVLDGIPATQETLLPEAIAVDANGNLFITDGFATRVFEVDSTTQLIRTIAGGGSTYQDWAIATSIQLQSPSGIAVTSGGSLYVADSNAGRVVEVNLTSDNANTAVGRGRDFNAGIPAAATAIYSPTSIVADAAGNLFIADSATERILEVSAATHLISSVAGNGLGGYNGDGILSTNAEMRSPISIALDANGNLYIADEVNFRVRRVDAVTHLITTIAGTGTSGYNGDNIAATSAQLTHPTGLTVDQFGNVFIVDGARIRKVSSTGIITTVVGNGTAGFNGDGILASTAQINMSVYYTPSGIAVDAAGNLYLADTSNNRVRKVDATTGIITTVAGTGAAGYNGDGIPATLALLSRPMDVFIDSAGNLFIADANNARIREVMAGTQSIVTIAGNGTYRFNANGVPATSASFSSAYAIFVDSAGHVFAADEYAGSIIEFGGLGISVTAGSTSTTLSTPAANSIVGQQIKLSSTVQVVSPGAGTLTGEVTFYDGAKILGSPHVSLVNGQATAVLYVSTLTIGSHSISAVYHGDPQFNSSAAATVQVNVVPIPQPSVTNSTTVVNTQSSSGLVITPEATVSSSVTNFQISNITGGTLFLNDGVTPVTNGQFISAAQGAAGLKFTPATNSLTAGSFVVQQSTSANVAGIIGTTAVATIAVTLTLHQPTITAAETAPNTMSTSGLVITPNAADTTFVTNFQISNIQGGSLFLADGTTKLNNGDFITIAQGADGLKFKPGANPAPSTFQIQESTSTSTPRVTGPSVMASIIVDYVLQQPSVSNATTTQNTQTNSGLRIMANSVDIQVVGQFKITNISGGLLYSYDGVTPVTNGQIIDANTAIAGLKFTPAKDSLTAGSFMVQEYLYGALGPATTATITVNLTLHQPTVTNAATNNNTQTTSGLVISPNVGDAPFVTNFQISGISGGTLYLNDGTTPIVNGQFISIAQGAAGLKFTPDANSLTGGSFTVQESTSANIAGLGGTTATAAIAVNLVLHQPTATNSTTAQNTMSASGLVITPNAADAAFVTNFQITNITNGSLFLADGTTQLANGQFITIAQGAAGLKFRPAANSLANGSFVVQESTSNSSAGLGGTTATATISVNLSLHQPSVTNAVTNDNTQSTSGLVITPNAADAAFATNFQITNIVAGTLYLNDGLTAVTNGQFIPLAQGAAGLKFTPSANSLALGSFTVQESTTATAAGLGGPTVTATITVGLVLHQPSVTNAATTDNTQTASGLVITPSVADTAFVTNFQVTNITGGSLFLHDGVTTVTNGQFITVAQGAAGLKFTPASNSLTAGSFTIQESTSGTAAGLGGQTASATVSVTLVLHQPSVTNSTTADNTQTSSGLVISPNAADAAFVTNYQISNIVGGTLFFHDGVTPVTNGQFITVAQGAAGLKFTPTMNTLTAGSFRVQQSTTATAAGLGGTTAIATIGVNLVLHQPSVTNAATTDNTQSSSGLVITPNAADAAFVTNFQITNITGGTLFLHDGVTPITNGQFISVAQGSAGFKFTPAVNSLATGSFTIQESTSATVAGLGGSTATASISVSLVLHQPSVTNATTNDNTQSSAGLVITSNAADTAFVTNFQITNITGGTLFLHDGVTPITNGQFITATQASAGLKFTPTTNSLTAGSFTVQESTSATAAGLGGPVATATINVSLVLHQPTVSNATTGDNTQTSSGLIITPNVADAAFVTNFQITNITGGTLFLSDGLTVVANGQFITVAQGAAGLKFTPASNSLAIGRFTVQQSASASAAGLGGSTALATITVNLVLHQPSATNSNTTNKNQTTSGLVITPNSLDSAFVTNFQITNISGGTLYLNDGVTQLTNGQFITVAQGAAGLKFTPSNASTGNGTFVVQESTSAAVAGLAGPTATATVTVTTSLSKPTVTNASTVPNTQTTSGLVITPNAADVGVVTNFQITSIVGGTLYLSDGRTPVANGKFITLAQGAAGLKFSPTSNSTSNGSFTVQESTSAVATGLGGQTATATITVARPPTIKAPLTASVAQNGSLAFNSTRAITVSDPSGTTEQMTLTVSHGTLTLGVTTGVTISSSGASLTISGPLSSLNTSIASLVYTPTLGYFGTDTLKVTDTDTADHLTATANTAITVTALPPSIKAPATAKTVQESPLTFTGTNGISLVDPSGSNEQLTLTVTHGTLSVATTSGVTLSGSGGSLTLTGSLTGLNTALLSLKYSPAAGYHGADTLKLTVKDTVDNLSASATVAVTVTALPPTLTAPTTISVAQNSSLLFTGSNKISVADPSGSAEKILLSVTHGTLSLSVTTGVTVTGSGVSLVVSGTLTSVNAALASLKYTPTSGYHGADTLKLTNTDTSDQLSATASVAINVTALPPAITAPSSLTVASNGTLIFSGTAAISVTDLSGTAEQLTVSVSHGTVSLGVTRGVTVSGSGSSITITGALSRLNTVLSSLKYVPTTAYHGSDTLKLTVKDTGDSLTANANVALTVS